MEKFAITVIGKTILRSAINVAETEIEQTETESPSADEYKFFLDKTNLKKTLKIWFQFQIKNEPSDWNIIL